MPAEIVENVAEEAPNPSVAEVVTEETKETLDDVIPGQPIQGEATQETEEQSEIPEKYRGKTQRELIEMHQNAEQRMGQQGNEVGELRHLVDTFIRSQMEAQSQATETPEEAPDFHLEPEAAVAHAVENHPAVREAKANNAEMKRATSQAQLQAKHPDMAQILADPKFSEWVKASPTRLRLYAEADQTYNFDSADELFTLYKERTAVVAEAAQTEAGERKKAVQAASTGSAKASSAPASRKIYRRADIIKLMQTDPSRYEAMQPEIMAAYAEGRVK